MRSRTSRAAAAAAVVALLLAACGGEQTSTEQPTPSPAPAPAPAPDMAADYPSGPIELSIPLAPGGGVDTVTRLIEPYLSEELGVRLDPTDRSGGAGAVGVAHLMAQPTDGQTVIAFEGGVATTGPAGNPDLPYDPEDIVPVARMTNAPWVMIATKASGITTLDEFIEATNRPEGIRVGIAGVMSIDHYGLLLLEENLNADGIRYVVYGGGGPKRQAIYAGEIDVILDTAASIDDTLVTPLAVFAENRLALFPDIPTTTELGYPKAVATLWIGLGVLKGTPDAIVDKLAEAVVAAASNPEFEQRLNEIGLEADPLGRAEFSAFVENERSQAKALVEQIQQDRLEIVG